MARGEPCPHGMKTRNQCSTCRLERIRKGRAENPQWARTANKNWRKNHPERHKANKRNQNYRSLYGITRAEAVAMREAQGNLCAICRGPMTDAPSASSRWVVDHYDTPAGPVVRGILHQGCNAALGLMNDHDPEALRNAADYLERRGRASRVSKPVEPEAEATPNPQLRLIP